MLYCDENIFFVHMYTVRIGLNQPSRQFKKKKLKERFLCFVFLKIVGVLIGGVKNTVDNISLLKKKK